MLILPHPAHVYKYIKIALCALPQAQTTKDDRHQSERCAAVEDVAQATAEQKVAIARDDGPMDYWSSTVAHQWL